MAEISKKDLKEKVDKLDISEDNKIELFEDIDDSIKEETEEKVLKSEYDAVVLERDNIKKELEDVKRKYKERFLSGEEVKALNTEDEDLKEEKIIDVKEI